MFQAKKIAQEQLKRPIMPEANYGANYRVRSPIMAPVAQLSRP